MEAIARASSIETPANLIEFATARSMVSEEPARLVAPGTATRPEGLSSMLASPILYDPGGDIAAAVASVTRIERDGDFARIIAFTVAAGRWCPSTIKLATNSSAASCSQIIFGCRGRRPAQPLPR